ncbi:hypothetical protein [Flavobacterium psychrophilum]|uniref:hypothetical protein n=1 Tax=Flavobacterium psychrophilum TaxID=96345 RepID=UPI000B7C2BA2|nr:hypothetical protein [Flavobacterium psychrophilum]MCB6089519.1 hypothetical protein [Flavobacterium psychrophilum]MEB3380522.1 hypothetical protein [Flavobacterium psychrophilum]SNA87511.1 hypothetical protein DK095_660002 [Flavobacterium psychrophilum]
MRKIYYVLIFIFSFSVLSAQEKLSKEEKARREKNIQAGNPFAKYGYKAKVATLSKGKYLEFHDLDSIVTIGTSRWHVDNKKIVGDIVIDSLNVDAQPIGDAPGMWMSPDPLSEEFPDYSPYSFCFGNPMKFVDPDGRAPLPYNDDIITKVSNTKGDAHYVQRDVSIRMTLTIVNSNGTDLSKTMFNKSSGSIEFSSMTGNAQKDYRVIDVFNSDNLKNVSIDYKVVSSLKDVGKNDHVMMLVDNIPKTAKGVDPVGLAIEGGRVSAIEVGTIKNKTFNEAAQHEIGHNLGLDHKNGGLMNPSITGSTSTNSSERGEIIYNQLGPKQGNGTYTQSQNNINYNTRIQTQANDFLSRNNIK